MPTDTLDAPVIRPPDLWRAWEATADYVSQLTKQETTIHLAWNSHGMDAPWMAQFTWVGNVERVKGIDTAGGALIQLWQQINAGYQIFENTRAARRAPRAYPPDQWFTASESTLLTRLVTQAQASAQEETVTLLVTCQAGHTSEERIVARMMYHVADQTLRGQGTTLLSAFQDLYPRVASHNYSDNIVGRTTE